MHIMPQPTPDSAQRLKEHHEKWKRKFFANMPPRTKDPVGLTAGAFCDLPIEEPDDIDLLDLSHYVPRPTPFDEACKSGPASAVQKILENEKKKFTSAQLHRGLYVAIQSGNADVVGLLLDQGAPIVRSTPSAIREVQSNDVKIAILEQMFAHGWTPNTCGFYGSVLIENFSTNLPLLRWLLEHGANPNLGMQRYTNDRYGGPDSNSCLALERASGKGNVEAVKLLLKAGAKINNGNPLHAAAGACAAGMDPYDPPVRPTKEFDESLVPVMEVLVAAGADVNQPELTRYITQTYPIVYAVSVGALERTRWLLNHGADPTFQAKDDDFFGSAIDTANKYGTDEMKQLLGSWKRPSYFSSVQRVLESMFAQTQSE